MDSFTREKQNQLPNFLAIGSQRCASTWLHSVLKEHPEITLAPKEYQFWSNKIKTDSLSSYYRMFAEIDKNSINKIIC